MLENQYDLFSSVTTGRHPYFNFNKICDNFHHNIKYKKNRTTFTFIRFFKLALKKFKQRKNTEPNPTPNMFNN